VGQGKGLPRRANFADRPDLAQRAKCSVPDENESGADGAPGRQVVASCRLVPPRRASSQWPRESIDVEIVVAQIGAEYERKLHCSFGRTSGPGVACEAMSILRPMIRAPAESRASTSCCWTE